MNGHEGASELSENNTKIPLDVTLAFVPHPPKPGQTVSIDKGGGGGDPLSQLVSKLQLFKGFMSHHFILNSYSPSNRIWFLQKTRLWEKLRCQHSY